MGGFEKRKPPDAFALLSKSMVDRSRKLDYDTFISNVRYEARMTLAQATSGSSATFERLHSIFSKAELKCEGSAFEECFDLSAVYRDVEEVRSFKLTLRKRDSLDVGNIESAVQTLVSFVWTIEKERGKSPNLSFEKGGGPINESYSNETPDVRVEAFGTW